MAIISFARLNVYFRRVKEEGLEFLKIITERKVIIKHILHRTKKQIYNIMGTQSNCSVK